MLPVSLCVVLGLLLGLASLQFSHVDACPPLLIPVIGSVAGVIGAFAGGRVIGGRQGDNRPESRLIGCFGDGPNTPDMGKVVQEDDNMSLMLCSDLCRRKNTQKIGLQNGTKCFCSNTHGKYGETSGSRCNIPCAGNNKDACGGYYANSVYKL